MYHFGSEDAVEVTQTSGLRRKVTALKEDHQREVIALKEGTYLSV